MTARRPLLFALLATAVGAAALLDSSLETSLIAPVHTVATSTSPHSTAKKFTEVSCRSEIKFLNDWVALRSEFLDREIHRVLLSEKRVFDFKDLCPNYPQFENKADFWADLLKEIAGHASDFHPLASFGNPEDREHVARGLFQIDEISARRYRCDLRGLDTRCALHDPKVASGCAVKIVSELSGGNRQVTKNLAERWSVLRQRREVHAAFEKNESCLNSKSRRYEPLKGHQSAGSNPRFHRPAGGQRTARDN